MFRKTIIYLQIQLENEKRKKREEAMQIQKEEDEKKLLAFTTHISYFIVIL